MTEDELKAIERKLPWDVPQMREIRALIAEVRRCQGFERIIDECSEQIRGVLAPEDWGVKLEHHIEAVCVRMRDAETEVRHLRKMLELQSPGDFPPGWHYELLPNGGYKITSPTHDRRP